MTLRGESLIISLKSDARGSDDISTKITRTFKKNMPPLTHVRNLTCSGGTFLDAFKQALVIPVHKRGLSLEVSSYRPTFSQNSIWNG